jgi:UDP-glucose-4-epimerase GalE
MRVLVTGAAGYIGAHVARALEEAGHAVVRFDDMSTGDERNLAGADCTVATVLDREAVGRALEGCDAVAHLAGAALVPESVRDPAKYWRINLAGGLTLVEEMIRHEVGAIVFSSTCAVYGVPAAVPIEEDSPHAPLTPYGASKAAFERVLADHRDAHGLKAAIFRYFNAAGAHDDGDIGEIHEPETHLIPNVLAAAAGRREALTVFGADYPTEDGTCVRDYVDVRDIARAHVLALEAMGSGRLDWLAANLGTGAGASVLEVLQACEEEVGRRIPFEKADRRPGDPAELVAAVTGSARELLGWEPRHDLQDMVASAWAFHRRLWGS